MKFLTLLAAAVGLVSASALPAIEERDVQTVSIKFRGGPAEYSLTFPADGSEVFTNNALSVSIIESAYYISSFCTFYTAGEKALQQGISSGGLNQLFVGPPQPIKSVRCQGFCLPVYGDCYRNGQYVGPCCNGFCAANKCRPWVNPYTGQ
ncbi:hypothetical protein QBC40DRAFT_262572 [Triangularia verruculosa]|uniref:Uncharacterized protein n=1 Tax=Triangularia verruculosa TaxID=2587418 RepID=A0AAN6XNA7_9PEZI|nr:hypothetical protein QBC40DRAFT_262572 [Triangularia verruculosa]